MGAEWQAGSGFMLAGSDNTDAGRRDYSLSDYDGRVVVLVSYR